MKKLSQIFAKIPSNYIRIAGVVMVILWLNAMVGSDSLFIPYLITGVFAIFCCIKRPIIRSKHLALIIIFSLILAFFNCIANYHLFPAFSLSQFLPTVFQWFSLIFGSFFTFYNIFSYLSFRFSPAESNKSKDAPLNATRKSTTKPISKFDSLKPYQLFLISFALITVVYLLVLFLCKYPGNLSFDSIQQVNQGLTGEYSNRNPFIHTIIIKAFVDLGQSIFGNLNAGVATYVVVQVIVTAAIFALTISTLKTAHFSKKSIIILLLIYLFTPFFIAYSLTVWKDCMLAIFMLLLVTAFYRLTKPIGTQWLNYLLLFIGAISVSLFKGNGLYVVLAFTLLFIILNFRHLFKVKTNLFTLLILLFSICSVFIYNKVLPNYIDTDERIMDSISIPAQQIAKTVIETNDLSDDERELLGHVVNFDTLADSYKPFISDPMKEQVWRSSGGEDYLSEHKSDFIKLYFRLGLSHPLSYVQAWADQTKGYLNGGYRYWVIANDITNNDLSIEQTKTQSIPNKLFNAYLSLFENNDSLRIIYCIGFFVWIALALLFIAIVKKDSILALTISIPLFLIATLWIATPVYSEFRYAYPLFTCIPFIAVITLSRNSLPSKSKRKSAV